MRRESRRTLDGIFKKGCAESKDIRPCRTHTADSNITMLYLINAEPLTELADPHGEMKSNKHFKDLAYSDERNKCFEDLVY